MSQLVVHKVPVNLITGEKIPKGSCPRLVDVALYSEEADLDILDIFDVKVDYKFCIKDMPPELEKVIYQEDLVGGHCETCVDKEILNELSVEKENGTSGGY